MDHGSGIPIFVSKLTFYVLGVVFSFVVSPVQTEDPKINSQ
jgi:hypothetical protein